MIEIISIGPCYHILGRLFPGLLLLKLEFFLNLFAIYMMAFFSRNAQNMSNCIRLLDYVLGMNASCATLTFRVCFAGLETSVRADLRRDFRLNLRLVINRRCYAIHR